MNHLQQCIPENHLLLPPLPMQPTYLCCFWELGLGLQCQQSNPLGCGVVPEQLLVLGGQRALENCQQLARSRKLRGCDLEFTLSQPHSLRDTRTVGSLLALLS